MVFSSIPFIYYFLPLVLLLYAIAPGKGKNAVLLLSSLIFYGWGEPRYLIVMILSIFFGYCFALLIERETNPKKKKLLLTLAIAFSLIPLLYFKYSNFFLENFALVTGLSMPLLRITLPVGISFYTFQILSYSVDVYRGDTKAARSILKVALYISMFPQLIAGPIVRYTDIEDKIDSRTHSFEYAALGLRRFTIGLAKKILLANRIGEFVDLARGISSPSFLSYWLYAIAFTLQIYFDFSAYSDMAIGLGRFFGFEFMENFNYPLISKSITEFWRRWHISLGTWFRDYVYIPLGGNRVPVRKHIRNIIVVWLLTGLWHGAAWNFVLWGLYFIIFLLIEKRGLLIFLNRKPVFSHLYTLFIIVVGMVIFNAYSLADLGTSLQAMFLPAGLSFANGELLFYLKEYLPTLIVAAVASTPLPKRLLDKLRTRKLGEGCLAILEPPVLALLILMATAYLVDGSFNPFLYFRF